MNPGRCTIDETWSIYMSKICGVLSYLVIVPRSYVRCRGHSDKTCYEIVVQLTSDLLVSLTTVTYTPHYLHFLDGNLSTTSVARDVWRFSRLSDIEERMYPYTYFWNGRPDLHMNDSLESAMSSGKVIKLYTKQRQMTFVKTTRLLCRIDAWDLECPIGCIRPKLVKDRHKFAMVAILKLETSR